MMEKVNTENDLQIRQEIIEACLYLSETRFFNGTWGNISVRVKEGMLITPSRVSYKKMKPEDLVLLSPEGEILEGQRLPSSEKELHRLLLKERNDFNAVVHTHSPYATCVSVTGQTIPVVTEEMAQIIGGEVRTSTYTPGGEHLRFAHAVFDALGGETTAALAANHGAVVGGNSLEEAVAAAEVLEKAAMIFLFSGISGNLRALPTGAIKEERNRYLYKYGKE